MSSTDNNGMTLFGVGTIDLDGIQPAFVDEESDQEAEREREEELRNELENAFDDLTDDESFQESSSLYSGNRRRSFQKHKYNNNCNNSKEELSAKNQIGEDLKMNKVTFSDDHNQVITPVWSDVSDHSGDFIHQNSIINSPTQFQLNMNSVVSQSDNSEPLNEDIPHKKSNYRNPHTKNCYDSKYYYKDDRLTQENFLSTETSYDELKLLYEARGRELDKISGELDEIKDTSAQEISSLKQQIVLLKAEKESLLTNRNNLNLLLSENESRMRNLNSEIKEKDIKCNKLEKEKKELESKLKVAEGTNNNLEQQVVQLQSLDNFTRSNQAHEEFLKKLNNSHSEQVDELRRKLKMMSKKVENYEVENKGLQDQLSTICKSKELLLQEKCATIQQLNTKLEIYQQQIKVLLSKKPVEISKMEEEFESLEMSELRKTNKVLELQLDQAKNDLESYERLLKLGLFRSTVSDSNDSVDQLNLAQALNFDESNLNIRKTSSDSNKNPSPKTLDINEKLKKELLQLLYKNKRYKEEIYKLNEAVSENQEKCRILESKLKSAYTAGNFENSKKHLLEENDDLKEELKTFRENVKLIKSESKFMIFKLEEFVKRNNDTTVLANILDPLKTYMTFISKFNTADSNLKESSSQNMIPYVIDGLLNNILRCLGSLKESLEPKTFPSNLSFVCKQVDNLSSQMEDLQKECSKCFQSSTQNKNLFLRPIIDNDRYETENERLKSETKVLKDKITTLENEKKNMQENLKDNYLKFHEEVVTKLKTNLQTEYNIIVDSLKSEVNRLSGELSATKDQYSEICCKKSDLENLYKQLSERKDFVEMEKKELDEESENLKETIEKLNREYQLKEENYQKEFHAMKSQMNELKKTVEAGKFTITENIELIEYKEKVDKLTNEIEKIKGEYEVYKTKIEKENDCNNKNDNDLSFTHVKETIKQYQELVNNLEEEKSKMKKFYEYQMKELEKKTTEISSSNTNQIRYNIDSRTEEEIQQLKANISSVEEEKLKFKALYEESNNNNIEELQKKDNYIKDMKHEWEIQLHNWTKNIHEMNTEKLKYKRDATYLLEKYRTISEKYSKLKKKFFRLQKQMEKLKTWSEDREKKILEELDRISAKKTEENESQFKCFKDYILKSRKILAETVAEVIENLKSIPERAMPYSILEPHINALCKVHIAIMKLDVERKTL